MSTIYPPPELSLHRVAPLGDLAELQRLLDAESDINVRAGVEQLTPLMEAARATEGATVATLRWLVDHGADLHARSADGVTAAWYAAGTGRTLGNGPFLSTADHAARLRFLLDAGLDPHETTPNGRSLLIEACCVGDPARVALLLERGVAATPWFDAEANRNQRSRIFARIFSGLELGERAQAWLERYDAEWNSHLMSFQLPLFCAVKSGSAACVQLLLAAGADVNLRDSEGATPLMYAHNYETVCALLVAGADISAVDTAGYDAIQHILEKGTNKDDADGLYQVLSALLAAGADINAELTYAGWTRLYHAAFARNLIAVERLLTLGADPTSGRPPLHAVCWHYNDEYDEDIARIIDLLVAAGCDVNTRDAGGNTLLHCAALGYTHSSREDCFNSISDGVNFTAVYCLLKHGANPDPVDQRGWIPLMRATAVASVPIMCELLAAGADPT